MARPTQILLRNRLFGLKTLVFAMFAMFAMTTDSVGVVIPQLISDFDLGLTAAGSFQYATMGGVALSAIFLGWMADRLGRKVTILIGLTCFGLASGLFAAGHQFALFVVLLFVSGMGIGIFKAGSLALIGDISTSTREHASTMNLVEGFFGVGAIIGPAIVAALLSLGGSWKGVYIIAAGLCLALTLLTLVTRFPKPIRQSPDARIDRSSSKRTLELLSTRETLTFGVALMMYVGAEASIYVWAPTYLAGYAGSNALLAKYVVSAFFVLRAVGRFLGVWLLRRLEWSYVLAFCSVAMTVLFLVAIVGGRGVAVFALPATGLFMSVLYPTINSTGISLHEKAQHGAAAGLLLFFTCLSAVLSPLVMAMLGDAFADPAYAIIVGAGFSAVLAAMCVWNAARHPFTATLARRNAEDYSPGS